MKITPKPTCAIAYSIQQLGDKWSLLIMRDLILHKKTRFKELRESKEKIASNILANRLKSLQVNGFIEKLDPTGTKKSTRYIATAKGIKVLPIIIELYLFSIHFIDESLLNDSQMSIKKQIISNRVLFEETRKSEYIAFVDGLKIELNKIKLLAQLN
ncbi:helix-turn-helix transcriptional regulator [Flavobacteriaceae bacterium]|nr:helix-turn-helix transcriptional regulator [Flavobacteriaceae bacterium]